MVAQVFNDPDVGEVKKEITPNGLLLYVVEDRIKGDYSKFQRKIVCQSLKNQKEQTYKWFLTN